MHFFLVNDDGIGAVGIMSLLKAASSRGHRVTMCAPAAQQSAASHRFTLDDPLYVKTWPTDYPNCKAYSVSGSPTDCVRIGLLKLVDSPVDVLISGINNGLNAGTAVHYSGTVGAAMEGTFFRVPSIASSIHHHADQTMIDALAEYTIQTAEQFASRKIPECTILNINAPAVPFDSLKGKVYCPLDTANFVDGYVPFEAPRTGLCYWLLPGSNTEDPHAGSDMDYLSKGWLTQTLIGNPVCYGKDLWDSMNIH